MGGPIPGEVAGSARPSAGRLARPTPTRVRGAARRSPTGLWPSMAWNKHTSTSGLHTTVSSAGLGAASPGPLSPGAPVPPTSASPMPAGKQRAPGERRLARGSRRRTRCGGRALAGLGNAGHPRPRRRNRGWLPVPAAPSGVQSFPCL